MIKVTPEQFEQMVWDAVDTLPEDIRARISNLEIETQPQPTAEDLRRNGLTDGRDLFGLYRGVPLTERDTHYAMVAPDLITIYQRAHERHCNTIEEMREQVAHTVRHELAHHFGIDDDRLDELGAY
jgi:predicted Zn-dependent protease with MMP-like domain